MPGHAIGSPPRGAVLPRKAAPAKPWNVVVTAHEGAFLRTARLLRQFGQVRPTAYLEVLTLAVDDVDRFLESLRDRITEGAGWHAFPARVAPARITFPFRSPDEFRARIVREAEELAPRLAGGTFYVRVHRRGFKGTLSSFEEEQRIADTVIRELAMRGRSADVRFEDPDAVIGVDIVDGRAGLSMWSREELARYRFLNPG